MQNDYRAIERRPAPPSPGPFAAEDPAGPDASDAFGEVAPATGPPATRNPLKLAWRALRQGARRGMTIIEIMVVMGIIAIIGTAIAFGAIEIFGQNQEEAARIQLNTIATGLDSYYVKYREYPDRLESLVSEGYLEEEQLLDPWRRPISYTVTGARTYELCSGGEDLSLGTPDDICRSRQARR